MPSLLLLVLLLACAAQAARIETATTVFSDEEVAQCVDIRIPQMTVTPRGVLLLAQCRVANASAPSDAALGKDLPEPTVGDDQSRAKVVSKFSEDYGKTWTAMRVLTPEPGHSHGQVVYDRVRNRVLMHYQYHPSTDPSFNSSMFQRLSDDCCGLTTWSPKQDITKFVNPQCNPEAPNYMQVGSAGSKVQTTSGRIIFLGHTNGKEERVACRWWTDDGGETYQSSLPYTGNEASVAEAFNSTVYMDGRGLAYDWAGNRTSSWSMNDGTSFSKPVPSQVREDARSGCSAGLVSSSDGRLLFLSEPAGPGRKGLVIHCSADGGHTWPYSTAVGGSNETAAYSALRMVPNSHGAGEQILVVWEMKPNFRAMTVDYADWCGV